MITLRTRASNISTAIAAGVLLLLTGAEGYSAFAAEKSVERIGCDNGRKRCERRCDATMIDVGWQIEACKRDCQHEWLNCLPLGEIVDAPRAPATKVQPRAPTGGVEHMFEQN